MVCKFRELIKDVFVEREWTSTVFFGKTRVLTFFEIELR